MAKKVSQEVKARALNYVTDYIAMVESQRQQVKEKWVEYDKAYRVQYNSGKQAYKGESKYCSPIIQDNIEAIVSRIYEAMKISDKALNVEADKNRENYSANKIRANIYKQMAIKQAEQQKIDEKKEILARMLCKYGNAIVYVPFIRDVEKVKRRVVVTDYELDDMGNPIIELQTGQPIGRQRVEVQEEEVVKYVGPGYEVITDLEDVYKDMFIANIEDQYCIVYKKLVTWKYIKEQVDAGNYYEDVAESIKGNPVTQSKTSGQTRSERVLGAQQINNADSSYKEYEIYEAWAEFDEEEDGEEYCKVITICNDQVLGYDDNPYWKKFKPFIQAKYRAIEGEDLSDGAIGPVLPLYYDYNDTLNQMNDAAAFVLNPIIIEFVGNAKSKSNLSVKPGAIWSERIPNAIRRFDMDMNNILTAEQRLLNMEGRINKGMGVTELMNGANDANINDADTTFRGTQKLISQSDKKFRMIANRFEQDIWEKWLEMGFEMNAQMNDQTFLYDSGKVDEQGNPITVEISPQDAIGEFQFKVSGVEHFFDLQDRLDKTLLFRQGSLNSPWIQTKVLDKQIAEMMGLEDIDQIIVNPPPAQPPRKDPSISISLNPKDGTVIATTCAQILESAGWPVDLNMAIDDAAIIQKKTAPTRMIQSGLLPDKIEEDVVETKKGTTKEKMSDVTAVKKTVEDKIAPVTDAATQEVAGQEAAVDVASKLEVPPAQAEI